MSSVAGSINGPWDTDPDRRAEVSSPSFASWIIEYERFNGTFNQRTSDALLLPMAPTDEQWLISEIGLLDAATTAVDTRNLSEAISICNAWQREAEKHGADADRSFFLLRGMAFRNAGNLDSARKDATEALKAEALGRCWTTGAAALTALIDRGDTKTDFSGSPPLYQQRVWWRLADKLDQR